MSSNSNKRWGASVKAVVVAAIMLLCAVSPMVSVFEDKNTLSAESADDVTIVSLGDSMVNGFGLSGYYPDKADVNYYGFLEQDTSAFPSLIRDWFVDNGYDVELHQLAISGVRSTDLRALLDPGFEGDEYTKELTSAFHKTVKKVSEEMQIIMITHRHGTMDVADTIYGITMQQSGVSRVFTLGANDDKEALLR